MYYIPRKLNHDCTVVCIVTYCVVSKSYIPHAAKMGHTVISIKIKVYLKYRMLPIKPK